MPSGEAQAALIKRVYESNGLDYGSTQVILLKYPIVCNNLFNKFAVRRSARNGDQSGRSGGNRRHLQYHWPGQINAFEALDW